MSNEKKRENHVPEDQRHVKTKSGEDWCGQAGHQNTGYGDHVYEDGEKATWAEFKTVPNNGPVFVAWRSSAVIGRAGDAFSGKLWIVQRKEQDRSDAKYSAEIVAGACLVPSKFVKKNMDVSPM